MRLLVSVEDEPSPWENPDLCKTGFFFLCMAVLTYMFAVCAVRVNVILFAGLHFLTVGFGCFTGVYWNLAEGNHEMAARLQKVSNLGRSEFGLVDFAVAHALQVCESFGLTWT